MKQKYIWTEFRKLKRNERFWLGTAEALKINFFSAWRGGMRVFVSPFRKVRTLRRYGKDKPNLLPLALETISGKGPIVSVSNPHFGAGDTATIPPGNTGLGHIALADNCRAMGTPTPVILALRKGVATTVPVAGEETRE